MSDRDRVILHFASATHTATTRNHGHRVPPSHSLFPEILYIAGTGHAQIHRRHQSRICWRYYIYICMHGWIDRPRHCRRDCDYNMPTRPGWDPGQWLIQQLAGETVCISGTTLLCTPKVTIHTRCPRAKYNVLYLQLVT
ncbi:hypothetical protein I7I48_02191 [Histoplasma ohiense]|nr:hypothetical protein I7I48_02191 [Histoplasma ohiense (nom. inval.)]